MCLFIFFSDKEVYSWGKSSRGRLGRSEENTTEPCKILFSGEEPFTVLDLSCSHGNTLLCTKRKCFLFNVFDLSCSRGNTLLCTKRNFYFSMSDLSCSRGNTLLCTKRNFYFSMSLIYHVVVETHSCVLSVIFTFQCL
jgi:alpha-tubulin suppressor-like RCC1 family protein